MKKTKKEIGKFLVVDVSNSFTKFAVATSKSLGPIQTRATPLITASWLRALATQYPTLPLFLSSVVPAKNPLFERAFKNRFHRLHGLAKLGIPITYANPRQVGADRLANAIAVRHLYKVPAIAIDFGTAVTFDVIDQNGAYAGGVIAPGLNMMTTYLHEKTALLPKVVIKEHTARPMRAIAQSTVEAIRVGAVIGYRGLVREIVAALKKELGAKKKITILATGGQATLVAKGLPEIEAVVPTLTLEGVRFWAMTILSKF